MTDAAKKDAAPPNSTEEKKAEPETKIAEVPPVKVEEGESRSILFPNRLLLHDQVLEITL